jgi:hypothetical protein
MLGLGCIFVALNEACENWKKPTGSIKCEEPLIIYIYISDRLCGLMVRVLGYRSGGPGSIPGTTRVSGEEKKKGKTVVGLERGPLSLVSTTEELLDRKLAAPV